jgi:hypothetical protein
MSKHIVFGTDKRLDQRNLEYGQKIYGARTGARGPMAESRTKEAQP